MIIQPNSTIAVSVLGAALNPATNTLITYTGTKSGSFNPTVVVTGGSLNSSLTIDESTPGQINLVAVPQVAITGQPQDVIASTNDLVTFTVTATGSAHHSTINGISTYQHQQSARARYPVPTVLHTPSPVLKEPIMAYTAWSSATTSIP